MHDLRAAPRWSKTSVVVVLVVFGLVLVVAVFGLWAFDAAQDRRRSDARNEARKRAHDLLEEVRLDAAGRFDGLLARVAKKDRGLENASGSELGKLRRELRAIFEGDEHGPLVQAVFRIDPSDPAGAVHWPGGTYWLALGQERVEALAEAQFAERDTALALQRTAVETPGTRGDAAALELWRDLTRRFGLLAYADPSDEAADPDARYPYGLAFCVEMLRSATNALTADPASVSDEALHDVLLRALEIAGLHRERARLDARSAPWKLRQLESELGRLLERIPSARRELPQWEIAHFRQFADEAAARLRTGHLRGMALDLARRGDGRYVDHDDRRRPYGISLGTRVVVALLDRQAVFATLRETLARRHPGFEELGTLAKVVSEDADPDATSGPPAHTVRLAARDVNLPYRLDLWQVGDPDLGADERNDTFLFWAVIGLAVAGLTVGGHVLVRLLTREIRLARLKADFVSNLSHELKTPITSISLFTEMLEEGKITAPEDQAEAFSVLGQESRRLQRTVHRMIDVARGEARRNPYDLAPGDLNQPVRDAVERLRRIVTEPGLDLQVDLHPGPLHLQMDRTAVDDAVTNLLSNAWKYKREDRARIVVRTTRRGRFAEVVVSDDGVGIPRRDRRKVFEMFYRSEQYLTHPVAGTGLGLALVRSVAAGHRGSVAVEPGPGGVGTTFRLRLPLDRAAQAALAAEAAAAELADPEGRGPAPHGTVDATARPNEPSARPRATNPGAQS